MDLGIGMFGDLRVYKDGTTQPAAQRLPQLIEEIKLMDETGIAFFGIGEHHRADYAVSSPEIILAAAATVTKNIKLGSGVTVLSSADPVRVYQNFATVDLLSQGRAEIMVGRGSFTESFPLFGYPLTDYDRLFEEKLELLLAINRNKKATWKGSTRAPLQDQEVYPRAANPELPVWVAVGGTPESVVRAAKHGLPVIFAIIGGEPARFKPLVDYYREAWKHFGHPPEKLEVGVHMHAFVGENSTQTANDYYPIYAAQMDRIGRQRGWPPYQRVQYDMGRSKKGHLVIGDATEAIEKILEMYELFELTRFSAHMDVGAPDHISTMKAIELYGNKIAPAVKKAIGK